MIKLRKLRCSFCKKSETEVLKLVAGPRVYICDACVAIASRMMDDSPDDSQSPNVAPTIWRRLSALARRFLPGSGARRVASAGASGG